MPEAEIQEVAKELRGLWAEFDVSGPLSERLEEIADHVAALSQLQRRRSRICVDQLEGGDDIDPRAG